MYCHCSCLPSEDTQVTYLSNTYARFLQLLEQRKTFDSRVPVVMRSTDLESSPLECSVLQASGNARPAVGSHTEMVPILGLPADLDHWNLQMKGRGIRG